MKNDNERMQLITALAEQITQQIMDGLLQSVKCCPNCLFWESKTELCHNKVNCPQYPARPPANIIALGCNQFKAGAPF